jgi:hypothetical protein
MSKILHILYRSLIITVIGILFTGCATTTEITHDYTHYVQLSPQEAIDIIRKLQITLPQSFLAEGRPPIWVIGYVDKDGFVYGRYVGIEDRREYIGRTLWTNPPVDEYKVYSHLKLITARVFFKSISSIDLIMGGGACALRLYVDKRSAWSYETGAACNAPSYQYKILSAFLTLCPNLK